MIFVFKQLRDRHNLKWFRIKMSYQKNVNIGQILQGDLNSKLIKGVTLPDFENLNCNCNSKTKTNGKCIYKGTYRHSILVYKATCKICYK